MQYLNLDLLLLYGRLSQLKDSVIVNVTQTTAVKSDVFFFKLNFSPYPLSQNATFNGKTRQSNLECFLMHYYAGDHLFVWKTLPQLFNLYTN